LRAIVSAELLHEYQLLFRRFPLFPAHKRSLLADLEDASITETVLMGKLERWVKEDPDDDKLIATGLAGSADALITSDARVLAVGHVGRLLIIKPAQFLKRFPV
jgi:predicted nucleic acid-binding protein